MDKNYDEAKYNAAFDRCIDVMIKLINKYGNQLLNQQKEYISTSVFEKHEDELINTLDNVA